MRIVRVGLVTLAACFALGGSADLTAPALQAARPAPSVGWEGAAGAARCGEFRYGNCPHGCVAVCVPSFCGWSKTGDWFCTQDCNGPGSCAVPAVPVGDLDPLLP